MSTFPRFGTLVELQLFKIFETINKAILILGLSNQLGKGSQMDLTILRNFVYVLASGTTALTGLLLLGTYICIKYDLIAEMPTALIGLEVVFPLVFTISASFERRDKALIQYGSLKAA